MQTASRISCPHCGTILRSASALSAGMQVQCVKCQAPFTISGTDLAPAPACEAIANGAATAKMAAAPTGQAPAMGILEARPRAGAGDVRTLPQARGLTTPPVIADDTCRSNSGMALLVCGALVLLLGGG